MKKASAVLFALLLTSALAGEVWADPSGPPRPNISDPSGDANGLNDQGISRAGFVGDIDGDGSHAPADIRKVWFENDHQSLSVNILTTEPPSRSDAALSLRVEANGGCLRFEALVQGETSDAQSGAWVSSKSSDRCGGGIGPVAGSLQLMTTREGSGLTTLTFRLGSHPNLRPLSWFFLPAANTRLVVGQEGLDLRFPQIDNTKEGISYRIEQVPPPSIDAPPPSADKPSSDSKPGKGKGKGHEKHGCDHPGQGHGHDDDCPEDDSKQEKDKDKGHEKHDCDHQGQGHGHDDDCPEEDGNRSASGKPYLF